MSRRRSGPERPRRDLWGALYPTLDLHGHTADEAVRLAERWIVARRDEGEGVVRIITGRGMHSVGPPVLPTVIEDLLTGLRPHAVARFDRETGGGAFRVHLTKPERRPQSPSGRVRPPDPELVRRAEAALAELGIDPTPSLIEAEIDRILREERGTQG